MNSQRLKKDYNAPLVRISVLFSLFVIFVMSYLGVMTRLLALFPTVDYLGRVSLPLQEVGIPKLDFVGYFVPLFVTLTFLGVRIIRRNFSSIRKSIVSYLLIGRRWKWYVASVAAISISFILPSLSASGHTDYPLTVVVVTYIALNLRRGTWKERAASSFVLGYLIGFVSDLQSQVFFTGIFGGGGWIDGDFILPVVLCVATLASRSLAEFLEEGMKSHEKERLITSSALQRG